jgi:hypothetical protein
MANIGSAPLTALTVGLVIALTGAVPACSDDAANRLAPRPGSSGSSGSSGDGDGGSSGAVPGGPSQEELLFRAVEADFKKKCGAACHELGTSKPAAPTFLAGPDSYKTIKAYNGIVVADYYQSSILNKGAHEGPAVGEDPTFETKLIEWLKIESAVIQSVKKPSTDPIALKAGANDIDLTKAATAGLAGVHLKFDAALVGGILSLSNLKLHAAAGTDVHILKPGFIKVLAAPDASKRTEVPDGAETFSNVDQTVPAGADTVLGPGSAFLTAPGWTPFDFAKDKVRIEVEKLEAGKVSVIEKPVVCKNVAGFTANVLPSLRGQAGGFNLKCDNCHGAGNGLAGLALANPDQTLVCNQVLSKLNAADITKSQIIVHLATGGGHGGGVLTDQAGWTALWTAQKAIFF